MYLTLNVNVITSSYQLFISQFQTIRIAVSYPIHNGTDIVITRLVFLPLIYALYHFMVNSWLLDTKKQIMEKGEVSTILTQRIQFDVASCKGNYFC